MVRVLSVPYVVGREAEGMGVGPLTLAERARSAWSADEHRRLALSMPRTTEVAASFDLNRQLADQIRAARIDGALPVVLTGNCHSQQAVVAGLGYEQLGLVWLDCHADFNTPATTETGYFDGYALSMVVGDCWQTLCATVRGFTPLDAQRVILAGVRDAEPGERRRLAESSIRQIDPGDIAELAQELASWQTVRVSLHVDLDVLDPSAGRANEYATAPGITADELTDAVAAVAARCELAAVTLSAYDPAFDDDGRVADAAMRVLEVATSRGSSLRAESNASSGTRNS